MKYDDIKFRKFYDYIILRMHKKFEEPMNKLDSAYKGIIENYYKTGASKEAVTKELFYIHKIFLEEIKGDGDV